MPSRDIVCAALFGYNVDGLQRDDGINSNRILCKCLMEGNGECFDGVVEFDGFLCFMYDFFVNLPMNTRNSDHLNYIIGVRKDRKQTEQHMLTTNTTNPRPTVLSFMTRS